MLQLHALWKDYLVFFEVESEEFEAEILIILHPHNAGLKIGEVFTWRTLNEVICNLRINVNGALLTIQALDCPTILGDDSG